MRFEILILIAGATSLFASELDLGPRLDRVAEVATAMVEGDVCLKIQTPRSLQYSAMKDPRDPWRAGDNYDVDHAAFFQTKKTLTRLQHLCGTPCAANLWMRVPSMPGRVQIVVRNALELSQYWIWGNLDQEMAPEMKRTFDTGERVTVRLKPGMVSVLAPVYDSLGDVVAIVEVVSQNNLNPRENVK
jgi:hypothetical protein